MDPSDEFKAQQQAIHAALVGVNRTVNSITAEDLTFLRTVNPGVATQLDDQAARLLRLSNGLLASAASTTGRRAPPTLEDADDVELQWKGVVDVIDGLLEKADTTLDEYTGMLKRKHAPTTEGGPESKKAKQQQQLQASQQDPHVPSDRLDWSLRRANIAKPQDLFEHKTDNRADAGPWKPLLTAKPHAIVPLAESLTTFDDDYHHTQYRHPYEAEITQMHYPEAVYCAREPIRYQPPETTAAVWVDTFEGVLAMLDELRAADEIAVDLEHHDFRTYTGLLSLMQISTRTKDWIVDTLQPWRHKLEVLNEVFADPTKLKVFHGANSDIVWLQRDLGLYIVGLFDTYFASERLAYSRRSLAFLLDRFVQFDADKKYQMADWRIRPLTEEMLYYARSDTHYLLYIYDMVRNELIEQSESADRSDLDKNHLAYVLQRSKDVSLLRYEPLFADPQTGQGPRGWLNGLLRTYTAMSGEQFAVYRALFAWRDDLSRRLDESPGYIMPMRVLSDISRILPPDHKALWSLLVPTPRVTKSSMEELFGIIQAARASGVNGPTSIEYLRSEAVMGVPGDAKAPGAGGRAAKLAAVKATAAADAAAIRSKNVADLPDVSELRSDFSQLWGPSRIRSKRTSAAAAAASEEVDAPWFVQAAIASAAGAGAVPAAAAAKMPETEEYIALPPSATKETKTQTRPDDTPTQTRAEPMATDTEAEDTGDKDEAFTLKWGKGGKKPTGSAAAASGKSAKTNKSDKKRKEKRDASGSTSQAEPGTGVSTSDSDGGAPIGGEEDEDEEDQKDFVPFNYDTAGSVLNPKAAERQRSGSGKDAGGKKKKAFNPYGDKGGDYGPKAARRMHFEKTGKTATFKK